MRHLMNPLDFSVEELDKLFALADDIEKDPAKYAHKCDGKILATRSVQMISIHALLAESDRQRPIKFGKLRFLSTLSLRRATSVQMEINRTTSNFYPRSPCGERHSERPGTRQRGAISIHALLAESDCEGGVSLLRKINFYPRSPCGERRLWACPDGSAYLFLSTLSLRRATASLT